MTVRPFKEVIEQAWETSVIPALSDYTRIRCQSPAFDADWEATGDLVRGAKLLQSWALTRPVPALTAEIFEIPGRTPVLLLEADASPAITNGSAVNHIAPTVLIYGHLDKQPPLGEWRSGLDPFEPVLEGDHLYGRGTADDGYAVFAAVTALEALAAHETPRPRVLILIEASEESGSPDLNAHLDALGKRIGRPDLVLCLDSGCLTYDRIWQTTSLRGNLVVTIRADVLDSGVHSGMAGGIVPSSFRVLRQLLDRIEDPATGEILIKELKAEIPQTHIDALTSLAEELPGSATGSLPAVPGLVFEGASDAERLIRRAWAPSLAVTGIGGIPAVRDGGNVLRPFSEVKISLRLPPSCDAAAAADALRHTLLADPPAGAKISVEVETPASGWVAPESSPWVTEAIETASQACFAKPSSSYGEGGTIPFLAYLGERFPGVALVATGVLGPHSNAHGPNEFLHIPMAKSVTECVSYLVAASRAHSGY